MMVGAIVITIVVILAAVLFVVLTSEDDGNKGSDGNGGTVRTVPTGAFDFAEGDTGDYAGGLVSLSGDLPLSDCSVTIIDVSTGSSASDGPPLSESTLVAGSVGLNLKYHDVNENDKVDVADLWILTNAYEGDQIYLIHETGKEIANYIIP
jgi:hypothetical protein